jgi:hypothetical protein
MLQKLALFALTACALVIAVPTASANWYHEGEALKAGENPQISISGTAAFTSSSGGVHCATGGQLTIEGTGGTTDGHLVSYELEEKKCEVSGGLIFLTGGTTSLKSGQLTGTPDGTHNGKVIEIFDIIIHSEFNNGFKLTLIADKEFPLIVTPDNPKAATAGTATGEMTSTLSSGKVKITASGTILGEASGTYGIAP